MKVAGGSTSDPSCSIGTAWSQVESFEWTFGWTSVESPELLLVEAFPGMFAEVFRQPFAEMFTVGSRSPVQRPIEDWSLTGTGLQKTGPQGQSLLVQFRFWSWSFQIVS